MIEKIAQAAKEAGQLILSQNYESEFVKEGHCNFVTSMDIKVQAFLQEKLTALVPGSEFFAEEKENNALTDTPTWIVDPIDGTMNFMRQRRCSAISIGYYENKKPVKAVIYNPFADELFTAEEGKGAFLNGKPIHVSDTPYENSLIAMGTSPYNSELADISLKCAREFLLTGGDLRRCGSAAIELCDIACGRSDVFFEMILSPWDFAAGVLIVREAGGVFDEFLEEKDVYDKKAAVLACNQTCYKEAKAILDRLAK